MHKTKPHETTAQFKSQKMCANPAQSCFPVD